MPARPVLVDLNDPDGRRRRLVIRLDPDSAIPPFEQVRAQVAVMVAVGLLEPGTRLPTIRALADILDLAPGTVARAYRELELGGIVIGRGRNGTFVTDEPPASEALDERKRRLHEGAQSFATHCRQLGVGRTTAVEALTRAFDDLLD